ncbi:MAG: hypothetical protein ABIH99_00410 [Candidatus Micrarchaeota archaeon]
METIDRARILEDGKVELKVLRSGTIQFEEFKVKRIPSPAGAYAVLEVDKIIDMAELARLAEECQLPIFAKNAKMFPPGTSSRNFLNL